jgi:hypothetical protein
MPNNAKIIHLGPAEGDAFSKAQVSQLLAIPRTPAEFPARISSIT